MPALGVDTYPSKLYITCEEVLRVDGAQDFGGAPHIEREFFKNAAPLSGLHQ
jgi:hypothetical protein